ncbi:hypothetical protein JCM10450v2_001383 [Rhodotorula kratochvilovae]
MASSRLPGLRGDGRGNYRVVIWGNAGAGKTTLARRLAVALPQLVVIPVDDLFWNDGWVMTPSDEFAAKLRQLAAENDSFVTDANALKARDAFLSQATDIVWLDWPLHVTLWRLLKRTWRRLRTAEVLFGTTDVREDWRETFFSRKSIIWWCLSTHRYLRQTLAKILAEEEDVRARLNRRFTRPADLEEWVAAIEGKVKSK